MELMEESSSICSNSSSVALVGGNSSGSGEDTLFHACNCNNFPRDDIHADAISIIRIITSFLSVIGSASIILLVLLTGKLNKSEFLPLFILSVADFILAILWLIGGVVWLTPDKNGWAKPNSSSHTSMCYVLAVATTMTEIITFLLTAVYAQSAMLRIREDYINKGKPLGEKDKLRWIRYFITGFSYIFSWVFPFILVLSVIETEIGIDATSRACWCVVDVFNLRPDNGLGHSIFTHFAIIQASLIGPFFIFTTVLIIVYYIVTYNYARKVFHARQTQRVRQWHHQRLKNSQKSIKFIMIRLTCFVLIFVLCGTPVFIGDIYVWSERDRLRVHDVPDRIILYIHALFAPLQGVLNAMVYGWSRKEFRRAAYFQRRVRFQTSQSGQYESLNNSRNVPPEEQTES